MKNKWLAILTLAIIVLFSANIASADNDNSSDEVEERADIETYCSMKNLVFVYKDEDIAFGYDKERQEIHIDGDFTTINVNCVAIAQNNREKNFRERFSLPDNCDILIFGVMIQGDNYYGITWLGMFTEYGESLGILESDLATSPTYKSMKGSFADLVKQEVLKKIFNTK